MKTVYFLPVFLILFACNSTPEPIQEKKSIQIVNKSSTKRGITTAIFSVWGNCGMCKETIEKSVKKEGVLQADWNVDTKRMTISFDSSKISLSNIQQSIANVGYDNVGFTGDEKAYTQLHTCCQYLRKQ